MRTQQFIAKVISIIFCLICPLFISSTTVAQQGYAAPVNVAVAELKSLAPYAWVSGTVVSRNNSNIASEVSGRLIELAELGSRVKKGDVIARIDDKNLQLRKKELTATVNGNKSRYEFLASEVKRIKSLAERNLSAKTDLDKAIADRDVAQGELLEAESRLAQINQDLEYSILRAPFDGLVTQRLSNLGEYVNNGNAIVKLVEMSNLEISVFAPITNYQFLKQAQELAIDSPMGKGVAKIKSLIPVADNRSHLMEIRLDIASYDWPVGLNVKVAVTNGAQQQVIAIHRDALVLRRDGISVFRIKADNTAEQVPVKVGIGAGIDVQVIGDVKPGDNIVIRGAERLQPGQAVSIKASNANLVSG
jgi:RND family efflux transporter MFP subunit